MRALEYKWTDESQWFDFPRNERTVSDLFLAGPDRWFPLAIRYDNGQVCTFKRKPKTLPQGGK